MVCGSKTSATYISTSAVKDLVAFNRPVVARSISVARHDSQAMWYILYG
jgi:hypothetical protein